MCMDALGAPNVSERSEAELMACLRVVPGRDNCRTACLERRANQGICREQKDGESSSGGSGRNCRPVSRTKRVGRSAANPKRKEEMSLKIPGRGICVKNQTEERGLLGRIFLRTPETPLNVVHCFLRVCPDTLGRITKFSKHEPN
jgi:hypothetical protein